MRTLILITILHANTTLLAGFVVSDWLGTHSGVSSILAGLDMTMPGDSNAYDSGDSYFGANLTVAVLNGTVPAWRLDDMAVRIMAGF